MPLMIGVDIGGTFTDFVVHDPQSGALDTFKLPSTPENPAEAVLQGLAQIQARHPGATWRLIHGSTVATNALLERKGAATGFIATRGFKDLLQIGRQNRPALYSFFIDPPAPLVTDARRFEVDERVDRQGQVLQNLDLAQVEALIPELQAAGVESVAVCFLFSFLHSAHEAVVANRLRQAGFWVSASHEVLPEFREYERASTTAVNAYVSPVMDRYLGHLLAALPGSDLRVMQSNGGSLSAAEARRFGVRCILSGPAGGVVGADFVAGQEDGTGQARAITFDMGGTSTDVALIHDAPGVTSEGSIGGCPVHIPLLDIQTIGAGGGSIASIDAGGALRVGPQSAGADPGPACYGRRAAYLPTVTDANLVLGRLPADYFLGGALPLYPEHSHAALAPLARQLGISVTRTAAGILEIVNAHMARALRLISVERGYDPAEYSLVSFGGAGGLHAAALARELHIPRVVISPFAAVLSALGMLMADVVKDYSQTVMVPGDVPQETLQAGLARLRQRGQVDLLGDGVDPAAMLFEPQLDVRYLGQSFELTVPFSSNWLQAFVAAHRRTYGYDRPGAELQIVNLRLRAVGRVTRPQITPEPLENADPYPAWLYDRPVLLDDEPRHMPHYLGERLRPGNCIPGPALVLRRDTTILIPPGDLARVDGFRNLVIHLGTLKGDIEARP